MEIKRPGDVPMSAEYSASAPNYAAKIANEALFKPKAVPAGEEDLYSSMGVEFSQTAQVNLKNVNTEKPKDQNPFQPDLPRITEGKRIQFASDNYLIIQENADKTGNISSLYSKSDEFLGTQVTKMYPNGKTAYIDSYDAENRLTGSTDYYPDGTVKAYASYNWEDGIYEKFTYNPAGETIAYEMTENGKGIRREYEIKDGKKETVKDVNIKSDFVPNGGSEEKIAVQKEEKLINQENTNNNAQEHSMEQAAIQKPDNGKTEYQYYSTGVKKKEIIYDKNGVVTGVNLFNEDGSLKKAIPYKDGKAVL